MDWSEGYRTEVTYTYGYYKEMNPALMRFELILAGFAPVEVSEACELGYGQGVSINIHAATENVAWTGTDFNPAQAVFARELSRASGAKVRCHAEPFHTFCERDDLPEFDFIALHGIWSWISPENRSVLIKLIDARLRIGGCLYISYNANPGWAAFRPARDLMKFYLDTQEAQGKGIPNKVADTFDFMEKLLAAEPRYLKQNPEITSLIKTFKGRGSAYVAHEFLNDSWEPVNFADMARTFAEARLAYACPADPGRFLSSLGLAEEQRAFLNSIQDPVLQETVRDFLLNTQFRKDYWLKGASHIGAHSRNVLLREENFILLTPADALSRDIKTSLGNMGLSEASHQVVTQILGDGKPHSLAELEQAASDLASRPDAPANAARENLYSLAQVMCALIDAGLAAPVQKKEKQIKASQTSDRLNAYLETLAIDKGDVRYLGSPVLGGGIAVNRLDMLFLLALRHGAKNSQDMASFALQCLTGAAQHILENGAPITDHASALEHLTKQADNFIRTQLPVLKNLMVA